MSRGVFSLAVCAMAALLWAAPCSAATTLRLAHHQAPNSMLDKTAKKFAELVSQKTNGGLKIRIFPSGQLGGEIDGVDLLNQGGIDLTLTSMSALDKYYPPVAAISTPFVFRSFEHAEKAMNGAFGASLIKGLKDNSNILALGVLVVGPRDMMFAEDPIQTLEGMKGVKMRSPEQFVWIRMFELLGAKPTPIPWGEVYTTLQSGVVAGIDTPAQQALDMKFHEVTKSLVKTGHIYLFMTININKNKFAGLSPEFQEAVMSAGREAAAWSNENVIKPEVAAAYSRLEAKGIKIVDAVDPEKWAQAVRPMWKEVGEKFKGADEAFTMIESAR